MKSNVINLKLPQNSKSICEEEMSYIDGGVNIGMTTNYLNKNTCLYVAAQWVNGCNWANVSVGQIAREIYGHAAVYYYGTVLKNLGSLGKSIYGSAANGVDIENKVDDRQWAFDLLWYATDPNLVVLV